MIDIQKHRESFAGLKNKYYFNFGGQGILSEFTLQKIIDTYQYVEEFGPFGVKINSWLTRNTYLTKKAIASEIGVSPETIALTENVTSSCNIALWGIEWQAEDEILLGDAEHPGIIATVKEISRRFGVQVKICPLVDTVNEGNPTQVIKNHLTPQTRLVIISHILWNTGQVLPLREIVSTCHQNQSRHRTEVLVDGAQSAGCLPLDLINDEVDYYGCTGHKWFCGPSGVGFLYIKSDLLSSLHPTYIGWRGLNFNEPNLPFNDDGSRYEIATSAYPLFTGLQEAISVNQQWGTIEQRYQRICELSAYLWTKLNELDGIKCLQTSPPSSGLVSFYPPANKDAQKIVNTLETNGFYLRTLASPYCMRACVHYLTLENEIDALIDQLNKLI